MYKNLKKIPDMDIMQVMVNDNSDEELDYIKKVRKKLKKKRATFVPKTIIQE